jgi:DNA-binding transcriptional regulator YiaG
MTDRLQIQALRQKLQNLKKLRITEAQKYCADLVGVTLSGWQRWERGERKMPQATWELANIKINAIKPLTKAKSVIESGPTTPQ